MIQIKRAYEKPQAKDGCRILVDRLWPRGRSKEDLKVKVWIKEIAPSAELRRWFQHVPERFKEFKKRYLQELKANPEAVAKLREFIKKYQTVTLIYGAREIEYNNASVLKDYLNAYVN